MKLRIVLAMAIVALVGAFVVQPRSTEAAANPFVGRQVTGDCEQIETGKAGTFKGTLSVRRFVTSGDQLFAVSSLSGSCTSSTGKTLGTISNKSIRVPAEIVKAEATCEVLRLDLGPLDLDLLGLKIHLNRVFLRITAESGPGNLLGNLICAIAGLLDANAPLAILRDQLNVIVNLLDFLT